MIFGLGAFILLGELSHETGKFELFSSKVVFEEFFRRILKASPLTNPFLTFGG